MNLAFRARRLKPGDLLVKKNPLTPFDWAIVISIDEGEYPSNRFFVRAASVMLLTNTQEILNRDFSWVGRNLDEVP